MVKHPHIKKNNFQSKKNFLVCKQLYKWLNEQHQQDAWKRNLSISNLTCLIYLVFLIFTNTIQPDQPRITFGNR